MQILRHIIICSLLLATTSHGMQPSEFATIKWNARPPLHISAGFKFSEKALPQLLQQSLSHGIRSNPFLFEAQINSLDIFAAKRFYLSSVLDAPAADITRLLYEHPPSKSEPWYLVMKFDNRSIEEIKSRLKSFLLNTFANVYLTQLAIDKGKVTYTPENLRDLLEDRYQSYIPHVTIGYIEHLSDVGELRQTVHAVNNLIQAIKPKVRVSSEHLVIHPPSPTSPRPDVALNFQRGDSAYQLYERIRQEFERVLQHRPPTPQPVQPRTVLENNLEQLTRALNALRQALTSTRIV